MPDPARIEVIFSEGGGAGPAGAPGGGAPRAVGSAVGWTAAAATAANVASAAVNTAVAAATVRSAAITMAGGALPLMQGPQPPKIVGGDGGALVPIGQARPSPAGGPLAIPRPQMIFTGAGAAGGQTAGIGGTLVAFAAGLAAAVAALKLWTTALEIGAKLTGLQGQQNAEFIRGNMRSAAIIELEKRKAVAEQIPLIGNFIKASLEKDIASIRAFDAELNALRERSQQLARFNGPLAGEMARSEVARIQREIAQGQALGPRLSEFERARRTMDTEEQIESMIRTFNGLAEEQRRVNAISEQQRKKNDQDIAKLGEAGKALKEAADKMREAGKKGALGRLLDEDILMPTGEENRGGTYDANRQIRDQQMNQPVFGGV